jgi:hypothetical protein
VKVRFVVDRIVIEGVEWSRAEREGFEGELREGLREALMARAVAGRHNPGALPVARSVGRERVEMTMGTGARAEGMGSGLGASLVERGWSGAGRSGNGSKNCRS